MSQTYEYNIVDNILSRAYTIRSYEVDARGRLSILSIFNLLQDSASKHALKLGVSVPQLLASNYTWVLSRICLKMQHFPGWGDVMHVHTWPSGIRRVFALRDFDMRQGNMTIGACVSAWIIIDAAKRRPIRPNSFEEQLNPVDRKPVLDHPLGKLPRLADSQFEKRFTVRYRDLDINQHVNNVSYVEWLLECSPALTETSWMLSELEVNFLSEALLGDVVVARCAHLDDSGRQMSHDLIRESDGQELIRARTAWTKIDK